MTVADEEIQINHSNLNKVPVVLTRQKKQAINNGNKHLTFEKLFEIEKDSQESSPSRFRLCPHRIYC